VSLNESVSGDYMHINSRCSVFLGAILAFASLIYGHRATAQTQDYVAKFNSGGTIINSSLFDNGNIGIGTTTPQASLEVSRAGNSSLRITNTNTAGGNYSFFQMGTPAYSLGSNAGFEIGLENAAGLVYFTRSTNTGPNSNGFVLTSSGSMGLGTTSPQAALEVSRAGNSSIRISNTNAAGGEYSFFQMGTPAYSLGSNAGFEIGLNNASGLVYFTRSTNTGANNSGFVLNSSGSVGIGTTMPGQKLEVNGNIQLSPGSGGRLYFPDGSSLGTAVLGTITGVLPGSGLTGGGYAGNVTLAVDSTVARTTSSQSFTGNQTIYGDLALGYINGQGGHFSANHGAMISDVFGGTPFSVICVNLGNRQCWATDAAGNSGTTSDLSSNSVHTNYLTATVKNFRIDHPLDPANKYLIHASVESSDVKNLYDGIVELDDRGEAVITLPDWFEALNRDFRYQLTAIGAPAPTLYIAEEITKNQFKIAGGQPQMKVSWLVTGIRQDAFVKAHPMQVEVEKPEDEKGFYTDATAFGLPATKTLVPLALRSPAAGSQ
jgi:hypothetical protein